MVSGRFGVEIALVESESQFYPQFEFLSVAEYRFLKAKPQLDALLHFRVEKHFYLVHSKKGKPLITSSTPPPSSGSQRLKGEQLGQLFSDQNLFSQALTHRSFHNENSKESCGHNERLEFLGDAVLDLALSDILYSNLNQANEGELSKLRASLVNETALCEIATELEIGPLLKLGKGESQTGGTSKPRLLASALEALIGALYIDKGFEESKKFLVSIFKERTEQLDLAVFFKADYKTRLQERAQEMKKKTPVYELIKEEGPDHEKIFHVSVQVGQKTLAVGTGRSKKQAEQDAAQKALEVEDKE